MDAVTLLGAEQGPSGKTIDVMKLLRQPVGDLLEKPRGQGVARGAAPLGADVSIVSVREASEAELEEALAPKRDGTSQRGPGLEVLRARHHAIARLIAAGVEDSETARLVGCTPALVLSLRRSPQFQSLLFSYMNSFDQSAKDYKTQLEQTAGLALEELRYRLASDPESFNNVDLRKTVEGLSDRIGHGPTSKVLNQNLALTAADIRELKSQAAGTSVVLPHQPGSQTQRAPDLPAEDSGREGSTGGPPIREGGPEGTPTSGPQLELELQSVDRMVGEGQ